MSIRTLVSRIVVSACLILGISGGQGDAWGQAAQSEQVRHYRAKTIALFREVLQLKREGVIVFGVFEYSPLPNFGAGNPRAFDWLQRVKRHIRNAPPGITCLDASQDFDLFVCDSELLGLFGVNIDEFNRAAGRLWVLALCTEHPNVCGVYRK